MQPRRGSPGGARSDLQRSGVGSTDGLTFHVECVRPLLNAQIEERKFLILHLEEAWKALIKAPSYWRLAFHSGPQLPWQEFLEDPATVDICSSHQCEGSRNLLVSSGSPGTNPLPLPLSRQLRS
jgi:hypothetical protein